MLIAIWLPAGAYKWSVKILPTLDVVHLKIAWPSTFTAENICNYYRYTAHGRESVTPDKDVTLREGAFKKELAKRVAKEGKTFWEHMYIKLDIKCMNEEPEVNFREYKTRSDDLGSRFKNVAFKYADRYMVIDCKVPSASFARKTFQPAMLLDADEESIGELSDDSGSVPIFGPRHLRPANLG